jgi:hypothetical protein
MFKELFYSMLNLLRSLKNTPSSLLTRALVFVWLLLDFTLLNAKRVMSYLNGIWTLITNLSNVQPKIIVVSWMKICSGERNLYKNSLMLVIKSIIQMAHPRPLMKPQKEQMVQKKTIKRQLTMNCLKTTECALGKFIQKVKQ